jgi:hypothetical protein
MQAVKGARNPKDKKANQHGAHDEERLADTGAARRCWGGLGWRRR